MRIQPAFLFDLDGTLVDSVYQHVLAWKHALDAEGIELSVWRIHRKMGRSGGLFTNQLLREAGIEISAERVDRLRQAPPRISGRQHRSGPCPAPANCSAGCRRPAFPGRSRPAATWKPQPSIWPRSASIRIGFPW